MSGTSEAVSQATRLSEIGFPEFTTKLITDVFDALISSDLRQTQAYIELLQATSKTLQGFINDTKDDISGEMLLEFLATVIPASADDTENVTALVKGDDGKVELNEEQTVALNKALTLPDEAGLPKNNAIAKSGKSNDYEEILEAVANRIAASKYDLLKELVKLGVARLVVENGQIETRLTFNTYGSSFNSETLSKYNRTDFEVKAKAKTAGIISLWVKASASTKYTDVKVSTADTTIQDSSGASVGIMGGVKINFKTNYVNLKE